MVGHEHLSDGILSVGTITPDGDILMFQREMLKKAESAPYFDFDSDEIGASGYDIVEVCKLQDKILTIKLNKPSSVTISVDMNYANFDLQELRITLKKIFNGYEHRLKIEELGRSG
ncbi:MAG: hypothetical protein GY821_09295 [Gammaproteobacteria bacterium]|nr:hypothetical protein [Gammaproteobacteria bacterium]